MISVIERVVIAQPPDRVFEFLADIEQGRRWRTDVLAVERVAATDVHVGDRYRERVRSFVRASEGELEITAYRPPTLLSFRDSTRATDVQALYTLAPEGGGATRVTLTAVLEPHGVARALRGQLARIVH